MLVSTARSSRFRLLARAGAVGLLAPAMPAAADENPLDGMIIYPIKTWVGPSFPTYGTFSTASNWLPSGEPVNGNAAVFSASVNTVRGVTLSQPAFASQLKFGSAGAANHLVLIRLNGNSLGSINFQADSLIIGGQANGTGAGFTTVDMEAVANPQPVSSISGFASLIGGAREGRLIVRDRVEASLGLATISGGSVTTETGGKVISGVDVFVFGQTIRGGMSVAGTSGRTGTLNIKPGGALNATVSLSLGAQSNFQALGVCNVTASNNYNFGGSFAAGTGSTTSTSAITVGASTTAPGLGVNGDFFVVPSGASISAGSYTHVGGNMILTNYNGVGRAISNLGGPAVISGGGLRVDSYAPGFNPSVGQAFTILQPTSLTGRYPVAVFPGFGDQRFLRAEYYPAAVPPRIDLVVGLAPNPYGFVPPIGVNLSRDPIAGRLCRFNGDVFPDLALIVPGATAGDPGSLVILTNAGVSGTGAWLGFGSSIQVAIGRDPAAIAVGDLNRDGLDDLVIAERGENRIRVLRNVAGAFPGGSQSLYTTGAAPTDVTINYFDELPALDSATLDIAVAARDADAINIFTNTGSGLFVNAATLLLPAGNHPNSIDSKDVDNDKDIDIVVGASTAAAGSSVGPIANNSVADGLAFGSYIPTAVPGTPVSIIVRDLDGDGAPDVLAATANGYLSILKNTAGALASPANIAVGSAAVSVTAADADGDGDTDPAILVEADVGFGVERVVRAYRNDTAAGGAASLTAAAVLGSGAQPSFVLAGDIDNDGLADLITGNRTIVLDGGRGTTPPKVDTRLATASRNRPGDVDGDGAVNFFDLNLLLSAYGLSTGQPGFNRNADFNRDGAINFFDLNTLLSLYGT